MRVSLRKGEGPAMPCCSDLPETFSPAMNNLWRWNFSTYTRWVTMKEKGTSDRHCSEQMGFWETTNKQTVPGGIAVSWKLKEAAPTISINGDSELDLKLHSWGILAIVFALVFKLSLFYFLLCLIWRGRRGSSISHSVKVTSESLLLDVFESYENV